MLADRMSGQYHELCPLTYYLPARHLVVQLSGPMDAQVAAALSGLGTPIDRRLVLRRLTSEVVLHLSYRCNLRCTYCSTYAGEVAEPAVLAPSAFRAAIDFAIRNAHMARLVHGVKAKAARVLLSGGGEPTLEWETLCGIVRHVQEAREREGAAIIRLHVLTNGQLSEERATELIRYFDRVDVSCDGRTVQRAQRPRKDGGDSLPYVERLLSRLNASDTRFGLRMTVTGLGLRNLVDDVKHYMREYPNLSSVHVEPVGYVGRGEHTDLPAVRLEEWMRCYEQLSRAFPGVIWSSTDTLIDRYGQPCHRLAGTCIVVTPTGSVAACDSVVPGTQSWPNYVIGSAAGGAVRLCREPPKPVLGAECHRCFALAHCYGGCPLRTERDSDGKATHVGAAALCELTRSMVRARLLRTLETKGRSMGAIGGTTTTVVRYADAR